MAWKEMKINKVRFLILGSIVFLVSLLTFIISGLANGLSQDNAALIKDLPNGQFYMNKSAEGTYNLSRIDSSIQDEILKNQKDAVAFSDLTKTLNITTLMVTHDEEMLFYADHIIKLNDGQVVPN